VIGVLDEMTVRPGCLATLEEHLTETLVPLAESRGLRLLQRWRAPAMVLGEADTAGGLRQQVLLLWAVEGAEATSGGTAGAAAVTAADDVAEWWRIRRGAGDPAVRQAWKIVDDLVEVRTRRFLEPVP
jgi:hypothetical protein